MLDNIKKLISNGTPTVLFLGLLMLVQRFLCGAYKPIMDDWFLYGDTYENLFARLTYFALPNEKFAIRPMAGFFDCFINAPLYSHLWIVELILTLSLLAGALLIMKTLNKNNARAGGIFLCLACLMPSNLEATYWIAAATRIVYSLLFMGASVYSLDLWYKNNSRTGIILYSILGFFAVSFYEPAIVMYIILTAFVALANRQNKRALLPIAIMCIHIAFIGAYYILNSGSGEIQSRGGLLTENILEHTANVCRYMKNIFISHNHTILENGFYRGIAIVMGGHRILKLGIISALSLAFGVFTAACIKNRCFSWKILVLGMILSAGGISLNFILGSDRIPLRLVYFSYLGIGVIIDELLMLLPTQARRVSSAALTAAVAFVFTVSGIGEVREYQTVSDYDVYITRQLVHMDTENNITNVDKNTYLFGGQHGYMEINCVHDLDHIRGASGSYAELTGCMRHITRTAQTNNIVPFTYGDIQILKPYIDQEGVCGFYGLEYDKTVIRVDLVPDGENYKVVRSDGSLFGTLVKVDDTRYQYFD